MDQPEVQEICQQVRRVLVSMRFLLRTPLLEQEQMALLRACHAHVGQYYERLFKLLGPDDADHVLQNVYLHVLQSEQRGRDEFFIR
jgi:DNA-directed RNA polymerase specialized sigma24 family protein